jgi:hypothetical protein
VIVDLINLKDQTSVKAYFIKVKELQASGEQYPVNLDEVWPLCYAQKAKAISVLVKEFKEGYDFHLSQMGKVLKSNELKNGIKIEAYLTVSAMEYFIARKIKEVFDVYQQVFQIVTNPKPVSQSVINLDLIIQLATNAKDNVLRMERIEGQMSRVEEKVLLLEAKQDTRPDYFTVVGFGRVSKLKIGQSLAKRVGMKAAALCRKRGFPIDHAKDDKWGRVGTYPLEILQEAYDIIVNLNKAA